MNKLKECNKRFDEIQEHDDMAVDNMQTAIISLATGNIQTARRLSERLFGEQQVVIEETAHGRTASTRSTGNRRLSRKISIHLPNEVKVKVEEESSELGNDIIKNVNEAIKEVDQDESATIPADLYKSVPKKRKI